MSVDVAVVAVDLDTATVLAGRRNKSSSRTGHVQVDSVASSLLLQLKMQIARLRGRKKAVVFYLQTTVGFSSMKPRTEQTISDLVVEGTP